ncbi:hypothetical protein LWF01_12450 [Saxibacter everestensis]|uniref:DUF559 domain-containing protein n=1 Tax=Saxibacter everestensis TaxID=2909229 RepID=A0ABY8QRB1_9MICO|nr:hypothetical protein LWF01_12450 [Brevibacteriaceae bacterium ZFBP1038]
MSLSTSSTPYEGDQHRTDRRQWELDLQRYEALRDAGWIVHRVTNQQLSRPGQLVDRVRRSLESRRLTG